MLWNLQTAYSSFQKGCGKLEGAVTLATEVIEATLGLASIGDLFGPTDWTAYNQR
jgi:hypothetical protein